MRWNGRQIRNACQTALALAEFDAQGGNHERIVDPNAEVKLTVKHLEIVSVAYLEFTRYLKKLYKADQDRLAQKRGYRAREFSGKVIKKSDHGSDDETDGEANPILKKEKSTQSHSTSAPPQVSAPLATIAREATVTAAQEYTTTPATNMPGLGYQLPNPGYLQGYPHGHLQGSQPPPLQPGVGFGLQVGGGPTQQQQQAQLWQNINPALWQQAILQGQMPPFGSMNMGVQQQLGTGPGTDASVPPNDARQN